MQGDQPLPDKVIEKFAESGMSLCPNLYLLSKYNRGMKALCIVMTLITGKSGIQTTAHGLRIACLGGIYDKDVYDTTVVPLVRHSIIMFTLFADILFF